MSGLVELAALCIVIVVGVPLACGAVMVALMIVHGVWQLVCHATLAAVYIMASPVWIPYLVIKKVVSYYRRRKEAK